MEQFEGHHIPLNTCYPGCPPPWHPKVRAAIAGGKGDVDETHPKGKGLPFPERISKSEGTSPSGVAREATKPREGTERRGRTQQTLGKVKFYIPSAKPSQGRSWGRNPLPPAGARQQQSLPEDMPWAGRWSPIASDNSSKFIPNLHLAPEFFIESIPGREDLLPKNP